MTLNQEVSRDGLTEGNKLTQQVTMTSAIKENKIKDPATPKQDISSYKERVSHRNNFSTVFISNPTLESF